MVLILSVTKRRWILELLEEASGAMGGLVLRKLGNDNGMLLHDVNFLSNIQCEPGIPIEEVVSENEDATDMDKTIADLVK